MAECRVKHRSLTEVDWNTKKEQEESDALIMIRLLLWIKSFWSREFQAVRLIVRPSTLQ